MSNIQLEKLEKNPTRVSRTIITLLKSPEQLIITILIGNELANLSISVLVASLCLRSFEHNSEILAILFASVSLLLCGEITPKSFAVRSPEKWANIAAKPLYFSYILFFPLRFFLKKLVNFFQGSEKDLYRKKLITEEEFKTLVDLGESEGELEQEESEMIHNVFEFEEMNVSKVMTPRTDMFCISIDTPFEDIMSHLEEYRFSRIPVFEGTVDTIIGILYSKELLHYSRKDDTFLLRNVIHEPIQVPGTKKLDELLGEFRKKKIHMAIVIDEYGGVEGLVSMEDLLEELFGEIKGEYEVAKQPIRKLSENCHRISAMVPIEDFNQTFSMDIEEEDIETIGGYVFHLFGRVPKKGESVRDTHFQFTVEKMKGARILDIKVAGP